MTSDQAFLDAIITDPTNDLSRLVYADYLDDAAGRMTERAELIRVQCELALWCSQKFSTADNVWARIIALSARENVLIEMCECELLWSGSPLGYIAAEETQGDPGERTVKPVRAFKNTYCRGFVEEVACTAEAWVEQGDTILRETPLAKVALNTMPRFRNRRPEYPRIDDDCWLLDDPANVVCDPVNCVFRANDIAAKVKENGDGNWLRAICELRWPKLGLVFELPSTLNLTAHSLTRLSTAS